MWKFMTTYRFSGASLKVLRHECHGFHATNILSSMPSKYCLEWKILQGFPLDYEDSKNESNDMKFAKFSEDIQKDVSRLLSKKDKHLEVQSVHSSLAALCRWAKCNHKFRTIQILESVLEAKNKICDNATTVLNMNKDQMSDEQLVTACYYLYFLNHSSAYQDFLEECEKRLSRFTPEVLACFSAIVDRRDLKSLTFQMSYSKVIDEWVRKCDSVLTFECLLPCLKTTTVSRQLVDKMISLMLKFIDSNEIRSCEVIVNCLEILRLPSNYSVQKINRIIQDLCTLLHDEISNLNSSQLYVLFLTLNKLHADLYETLGKVSLRAAALLGNNDNFVDQLLLLNCLTENDLQNQKNAIINIRSKDWKNLCYFCYGPMFVRICYRLRPKYVKDVLFHTFWKQSLHYMNNDQFDLFIAQLFIKCKLSSQASWNIEEFETVLYSHLLKQLEESYYLFSKQAAIACAFLILANAKQNVMLPQSIIDCVENMIDNFSISDLQLLSKCIEMLLKSHNALAFSQLKHLATILIESIEKKSLVTTRLSDLQRLMPSFIIWREIKEDYYFENLMNRHQPVMNELTSKTLHSMCNNIAAAAYYHPILLDKMTDYLMKNDITGWTAANLLQACYRVGYCPNNESKFFEKSTELINKHWNQMTGLKVLQAALSVALFHQLPSSWINNIFSVQFLDRLEHDIEESGTPEHAVRLKKYLFELNRVVCLEYPELNIPWFHANELDVIMPDPTKETEFHKDVASFLDRLFVQKKAFRSHAFTPYWYYQAFEFWLDHSNKLVQIPEGKKSLEIPNDYKKISINLLREKAFCLNVRKVIGGHLLKRRHMEMLGYTVVDIPYFDWYSLSMADGNMKLHYLTKKIFQA